MTYDNSQTSNNNSTSDKIFLESCKTEYQFHVYVDNNIIIDGY